MHIVYSALRSTPRQVNARKQGYLAACKKHYDTIAAIQQYMPGWLPAFEADNAQLVSRLNTSIINQR